jgi:hypothetical protein
MMFGRYEDNTKINCSEIGYAGLDWILLAEENGPVASSCDCSNES